MNLFLHLVAQISNFYYLKTIALSPPDQAIALPISAEPGCWLLDHFKTVLQSFR
jgi:hypothetical protein